MSTKFRINSLLKTKSLPLPLTTTITPHPHPYIPMTDPQTLPLKKDMYTNRIKKYINPVVDDAHMVYKFFKIQHTCIAF